MKFEYLKGSQKDFYGASDDDVYAFRCLGSTYFSRDLQKTSCGLLISKSDHDDIIAERRPIAAPKVSAEWNGEGLPPVGVECEFQAALGNWVAIRITAHGEDSMLMKQVGKDNEQYISKGNNFRPIRSPEEIARDEAIHTMASTPKPCGIPLYDICGEIYDAIAAGKIKGIKLEVSK